MQLFSNRDDLQTALQVSFGTTDMEEVLDQLQEWHLDGGCETPDGCWVEPDGSCRHDQPSWLCLLGLI